MSAFTDAFTPNKVVSRQVMAAIIAAQIIIFLGIWIGMAPKIIPRPLEILAATSTLWRQGVGEALWVSLKTNLISVFFATLISLPLAYLTVLPVMRPIAEVVSKMRFLGLTGLTLIFTLVVGTGMQLKVSIIVFGMSVYMVPNMMAVIAAIPREKYDHARTLRYGKWHTVWEVGVLGTLDQAWEVVRQNAAIGWMMLTMVEGLVRSGGGIGGLLLTQNKFFNLAAVFNIQFLILMGGLFQDWAFGIGKNLSTPWASLTTERR